MPPCHWSRRKGEEGGAGESELTVLNVKGNFLCIIYHMFLRESAFCMNIHNE